jgi:serine/threonine protein kinase
VTTPTGPVDGFPAPGERIGPYEIVRQLGMGGMGVVFEAIDTVLRRRVALKVISPYLAGDPAFRVRFTHEAQAQASLDSPHVVQVFAHGEADPSTSSGGSGSLYIASQLIPDGDLGAMIRAQGAPPPGIAVDVLAQIATGLADAHATGLVHRDIKPANVLLRIRGEEVSAYLADFGIARRTDVDPALSQTLTTQGFAVGTPTYMAPELHTGGTPGTTTDVYSLGCLLWAALCGRAPYTGTTDYQLVQAHVAAPIPQLVAAGPFEREVNRILRTAMAKHPSERYPSAAALRDDLRRVLRSIPAPAAVRPDAGSETGTEPRRIAPPVPAPLAEQPTFAPYVPPPARSSGRSQLIGLTVAVVLLIAIGVVGLVALLGDGDDPGGGSTAGTQPGPSETTDEHGLTADERKAADNIAAALAADASLDGFESSCTARKLVMNSGIDGLQEQGILDEDLNFIGNTNPAVNGQFFSDIITVGVSCVFETVTFAPSAS